MFPDTSQSSGAEADMLSVLPKEEAWWGHSLCTDMVRSVSVTACCKTNLNAIFVFLLFL